MVESDNPAIRELQRRMDAIERKFDWMDEHGSRAVNTVSYQVGEIIKDLGRIEGTMGELSKSVSRSAGVRWQQVATLVIALLPLYILTITILTSGHP